MHIAKLIFKYTMTIIVWFLNFLCWLLIPPLFLFIPTPIRNKWIRLCLFFISPIVIFFCYNGYYTLIRKYKYNSSTDIENVIGVEFPIYKVIDHEEKYYNGSIFKGYYITKTIEFKVMPNDLFYYKLDSLSSNLNQWRRFDKDGLISYSLDSLKVESESDFFHIFIEKGNRQAKILYTDDKSVPFSIIW